MGRADPGRLGKPPDRREAGLGTQRLTARAYREPATTNACDADGQPPLLAVTADQRVAYSAALEHDAQGFFLHTMRHDQTKARRRVGELTHLLGRQAIQLTEGFQVLTHGFVTAGLTSQDAAAGGLNDQPRHVRVLDGRGVKG